ncbi:MAG: hypothetical protein HC927_00540 [Deltaproteobacteria bacterium]|nr:hypothetical protein [Deltaproteobacteria bacterium]
MTRKVHQLLLTVSTISTLAACGDTGPCLEGGDGECVPEESDDDHGLSGCAPFEPLTSQDDEVGGSPPPTSGVIMSCQGNGIGWLVTDIKGMGDPLTSCLAYEADEPPENPTAEDCAALPIDLITNALAVPPLSACCTEDAFPSDIEDTCMSDCGYAAVKVAIEAMRLTAANLEAPEGLPEEPFETAAADLVALADYLETPVVMQYAANKVSSANSEVVSIGLGSGTSSSALLGHIKDAKLYLGCMLDPDEPYVIEPDAGECTEATNIPTKEAEQDAQGSIGEGSITVYGPGQSIVAELGTASFEFRETLNRDLSIDFLLTSFDAAVADTTVGSFALRDVQLELAAPASGRLDGETVTFAAGTLRMAVTAKVDVDGEPLFDGAATTAEYTNSGPATALRRLDGSFAFVDAPFEVGGYSAVLVTEPAQFTLVD